MWFENIVWALLKQPGLPHAQQENTKEKIWSQLTQALVAIPAPISCPMSCQTSLRYRSGYHWRMNYTALATQVSFSGCQGKRNQRTKLLTMWGKKKQSMCLKALLAASQGAQHLPGCISEPLVCMQPLSFPLQWQHRLYSSKTLKHILEL